MKLQTLIEEKTALENEKIDIYMNENKLKVRPAKITKDGRALFFETHNIDSSRDTKTNELNSGGDLNLNLEGEGLKIGVWDEGHVFKDHDEFQNLIQRMLQVLLDLVVQTQMRKVWLLKSKSFLLIGIMLSSS